MLDDFCRRLTTNTKIYSIKHQRVLSAAVLMSSHGFRIDKLRSAALPTLARLYGNAMSLPVFGAVALAGIVVADLGPGWSHLRLQATGVLTQAAPPAGGASARDGDDGTSDSVSSSASAASSC